MDEQQYITERLEVQIKWYSSNSRSAQKYYKWGTCISVTIALLIAPLNYYGELCKYQRGLISFCGILIAVINFYLNIAKSQETWISYRRTAELLKHEKFLFLTKAGGYASTEKPFEELVERCESIISSENIDWAQLNNDKSIRAMDNTTTMNKG